MNDDDHHSLARWRQDLITLLIVHYKYSLLRLLLRNQTHNWKALSITVYHFRVLIRSNHTTSKKKNLDRVEFFHNMASAAGGKCGISLFQNSCSTQLSMSKYTRSSGTMPIGCLYTSVFSLVSLFSSGLFCASHAHLWTPIFILFSSFHSNE